MELPIDSGGGTPVQHTVGMSVDVRGIAQDQDQVIVASVRQKMKEYDASQMGYIPQMTKAVFGQDLAAMHVAQHVVEAQIFGVPLYQGQDLEVRTIEAQVAQIMHRGFRQDQAAYMGYTFGQDLEVEAQEFGAPPVDQVHGFEALHVLGRDQADVVAQHHVPVQQVAVEQTLGRYTLDPKMKEFLTEEITGDQVQSEAHDLMMQATTVTAAS